MRGGRSGGLGGGLEPLLAIMAAAAFVVVAAMLRFETASMRAHTTWAHSPFSVIVAGTAQRAPVLFCVVMDQKDDGSLLLLWT